MKTFLNQVFETLLADPATSLSQTTFILPSKRAGSFLKHLIRKHVDRPIFAPTIWSIEDFIAEITGLQILDNTNTLFAFYEVYKSLTPESEQEDFDIFYGWAQTLIYDFNEIDRHLIDATSFFDYLADIKDLEHWSVQPEKTEIVQNYLKFWKTLPSYHKKFTKTLLERREAYQGLAFREAARTIRSFLKTHSGQLIFVGFNALNKAEQYIIQEALQRENTRIFWDIDKTFLEDKRHDAGYFMRAYSREWPYYAKEKNEFEWIGQNFDQQKDIHLIGIPKNVGQAAYAGQLLEQGNNPNTALILSDETLLNPILNALPDSSLPINITMGLSLDQTPMASLIEVLFKIQLNTKNQLYYKNVLDFLNHSVVRTAIDEDAKNIRDEIVAENSVFVKPGGLSTSICELTEKILTLALTSYKNKAIDFAEALIDLTHLLRPANTHDFALETEYLFHFNKVFNKLHNLFDHHNINIDIRSLHRLYKELLRQETLDFEGSPFDGLQLMGMLETRVLDFETFILTSVNEGVLPSGKSDNSFIPFDLKKKYGLPTYKEKDAVYAYHFYRLLQRAETVHLLYNSDKSGFNAGEKSRFLTQLLMSYGELHKIHQYEVRPKIVSPSTDLIEIPKNKGIINRLKHIAKRGFSPSALTRYIRNPLDFYKNDILEISDGQEVEETVAANTLGSVIHNTLEAFYKPLEGKTLTAQHLAKMKLAIAGEVEAQFKKAYSQAPIKEGKNLIIFKVAQRYVLNFIEAEEKTVKNHDVKILQIENGELKQKLDVPGINFPVYIRGRVDRVDQIDGQTRVVDYKTGTVEKSDLTISDWNNLTADYKYSKAFQVLFYSKLYNSDHESATPLEAGIICLKKLGLGFMKFKDKSNKPASTKINAETIDLFSEVLADLITELFDDQIPFKEKEISHA